jgi:hypothetical protein
MLERRQSQRFDVGMHPGGEGRVVEGTGGEAEDGLGGGADAWPLIARSFQYVLNLKKADSSLRSE